MDLKDEIDESVEVVGRRTRGRVASSTVVRVSSLQLMGASKASYPFSCDSLSLLLAFLCLPDLFFSHTCIPRA